jgi:hypothetical protein
MKAISYEIARGDERETFPCASGLAALNRLLGIVCRRDAEAGEYRLSELPSTPAGRPELLYRVRREAGRKGAVTVETENE